MPRSDAITRRPSTIRRDLLLLFRGRPADLAAARTRAHARRGGTGVVRDLHLVGLRDAVLHLDLDAIGQPELDVLLHEYLRRRLDLDERRFLVLVLHERLADR